MQSTVKILKERYPELQFTAGDQFYWSPETKEIFYNKDATDKTAIWSLLHETGHALLNHTNYSGDFELLQLEIAAWEKARELGKELHIEVSEDHIQDCLDTYRDWLHERSICPNCQTKCLQQDDHLHYRCFNCRTTWSVGASRFCRTYRTIKEVVPVPLTVP